MTNGMAAVSRLSFSFNSATYHNAQTCNYTKATPCLQADILGDWREELIMWNKKDSSEIMIFSTWTPTDYAVPTLMHDHVYRMGVAWQNTAYNQPPHLGYYLPDYINGKITRIDAITGERREEKKRTKATDSQKGSWYTIGERELNGGAQQKGVYSIHQRSNIIIKY